MRLVVRLFCSYFLEVSPVPIEFLMECFNLLEKPQKQTKKQPKKNNHSTKREIIPLEVEWLKPLVIRGFSNEHGRIRTYGLQNRNLMLYPTELRALGQH